MYPLTRIIVNGVRTHARLAGGESERMKHTRLKAEIHFPQIIDQIPESVVS